MSSLLEGTLSSLPILPLSGQLSRIMKLLSCPRAWHCILPELRKGLLHSIPSFLQKIWTKPFLQLLSHRVRHPTFWPLSPQDGLPNCVITTAKMREERDIPMASSPAPLTPYMESPCSASQTNSALPWNRGGSALEQRRGWPRGYLLCIIYLPHFSGK